MGIVKRHSTVGKIHVINDVLYCSVEVNEAPSYC
jgi:hypothetical protein